MKSFVKITLMSILCFILVACYGYDPQDDDEAFHGKENQSGYLGVYLTDSEEKFWFVIKPKGIYQICNPERCEEGRYYGNEHYNLQLLDFYKLKLGYEFLTVKKSAWPNDPAAEDSAKDAIKDMAENNIYTLGFFVGDCNKKSEKGKKKPKYCMMFGFYEYPIRIERVYTFPKENENDIPPKMPEDFYTKTEEK